MKSLLWLPEWGPCCHASMTACVVRLLSPIRGVQYTNATLSRPLVICGKEKFPYLQRKKV